MSLLRFCIIFAIAALSAFGAAFESFESYSPGLVAVGTTVGDFTAGNDWVLTVDPDFVISGLVSLAPSVGDTMVIEFHERGVWALYTLLVRANGTVTGETIGVTGARAFRDYGIIQGVSTIGALGIGSSNESIHRITLTGVLAVDQIHYEPVPEPGTIAMVGVGAGLLFAAKLPRGYRPKRQ